MYSVVDVLEAVGVADPDVRIKQVAKLDKLKQQIAESTDPDVREALQERYDHLTQRYAGMQERLDRLSNEYAKIKMTKTILFKTHSAKKFKQKSPH